MRDILLFHFSDLFRRKICYHSKAQLHSDRHNWSCEYVTVIKWWIVNNTFQINNLSRKLTFSTMTGSSQWLDVVSGSVDVLDWSTLSTVASLADSAEADICCWRDAWFSDLRFSQIFSFGGGAGTNLTGAAFSTEGFFVTFLPDSTSWSGLSSTSLETDLDAAVTHAHKLTHQLSAERHSNNKHHVLPCFKRLKKVKRSI